MSQRRLFGWLVSPYTAKVRAMLHFKRLPFDEAVPSALALRLTVQPAVGRAIMPAMQEPDGEWLQDSALMCERIEADAPSPSTTPPGATQRLASMLLELHGDEWLPMLALHFRWNIAANREWAEEEFGRCGFPLLPAPLARMLVRPVATKMRSFRKVVGISPETHSGLDAFAAALIGELDAHLASHAFLLGGAPCVGDFALYGPLWAHLYRDPHSRRSFDGAPHVVRWFERLHGHAADPATATATRTAPPPAGEHLPADEVPASQGGVSGAFCTVMLGSVPGVFCCATRGSALA